MANFFMHVQRLSGGACISWRDRNAERIIPDWTVISSSFACEVSFSNSEDDLMLWGKSVIVAFCKTERHRSYLDCFLSWCCRLPGSLSRLADCWLFPHGGTMTGVLLITDGISWRWMPGIILIIAWILKGSFMQCWKPCRSLVLCQRQ